MDLSLQHNVVDALHGGGDNNTVIVICTLLCVINSQEAFSSNRSTCIPRKRSSTKERGSTVYGGDVLPL